jgi:hypothetical protein
MPILKKPTKLNSAKDDIKTIEHFIKSRPIPSEGDLDFFIKQNEFEQYRNFATSSLAATTEREWILFQHKTNKYR